MLRPKGTSSLYLFETLDTHDINPIDSNVNFCMLRVSRVTRIRTKKYQRNTFYSHVESVESDKNKNKEISKKYILFSF